MSYHPGQQNTGLRFRDDTGIELRCDSCPKGMQWWPLTSEFWEMRKTFRRCRACIQKDKTRRQRERSRRPEVRAANREYQAAYRKDAKQARQVYTAAVYWADPEKHRAKSRERYYRNRDAILARKRSEYAAKKAA